ncbi:hypothetical protein K440DRAFT_631048 [Wilcoxina mikolae CBS 423.85]|nr:hypothetical protein K440DRAFT_631048 [Wilcoxina mikolae CBS 423.85]
MEVPEVSVSQSRNLLGSFPTFNLIFSLPLTLCRPIITNDKRRLITRPRPEAPPNKEHARQNTKRTEMEQKWNSRQSIGPQGLPYLISRCSVPLSPAKAAPAPTSVFRAWT